MKLNKKELITKLLKGIETGDPESVKVVNEDKYIQHNPQTHEGSEGLAVLFKRLSKTSPRVNIVRVFQDADFVFAHTEYDFESRNIGFEIFRFEEEQAVEHWDNIQKRLGPNSSGHSMVDGETQVSELESTETNRAIIQSFVQDLLIGQKFENINQYIKQGDYIEHSPHLKDDVVKLIIALSNAGTVNTVINYEKCHRVLAEGNFVLSVCEGKINSKPASLFDLYRLQDGKIVEHWDTREIIPSRDQWKNNNGKF